VTTHRVDHAAAAADEKATFFKKTLIMYSY